MEALEIQKTKTSEAQKDATRRYRQKTYDTIGFDVRKDRGGREKYHKAAASFGLSLQAFIVKAMDEFIQVHTGENAIPVTFSQAELEHHGLNKREQALWVRFKGLPKRSQKDFMRLMDDFARKCGAKPQAKLEFKEMEEIKGSLLARFNLLPERAQQDFVRLTSYLAEKCGTELETDEQEGD